MALYDLSLAAMAVAVEQKQKATLSATFNNNSDTIEGMHGQTLSISRGFLTGEVEELEQSEIGTKEVVYNRLRQNLVQIELSILIRYGWAVNLDWSTFVLNPTTVNDYRILVDPAVNKMNAVLESKAATALEAAAALTADPTETVSPDSTTPRSLPGIVVEDFSAVEDEKKGKRVRQLLNRANTELSKRTQVGQSPSDDTANRFAVLGTEVGYWLLSDDFINSAAHTESTDALRRAIVGQLSGFNVIVSNRVDENSIYAYTKEAFMVFGRTPAMSHGAKFSTIESGGIIPFRYNLDYNGNTGEDVGLVSAFISVSVVNPQFVVGYRVEGLAD